MDVRGSQLEICRKYNVDCVCPAHESKLGISRDFFSGSMPLNGLRHSPAEDTCGWYLWAGEELSQADDYFQAMHVYHLKDRCPEVLRYLGLPPGWRFLIAGDYEDVWFDEAVLIPAS